VSAEPIALCMAAIYADRVAWTEFGLRHKERKDSFIKQVAGSPVIDATAVYDEIINTDSIDVYGDHEIHPVWPSAVIAYENTAKNVIVLSTYHFTKFERWETVNEVDWSKATGVLSALIFAGNLTGTKVVGPIATLQAAHDVDGGILDVHWSHENGITPDHFQNAMLVFLRTYTLAACTNVMLTEPARERAQRRRIERTGVTVSTIAIRPMSKTTRTSPNPPSGPSGTPTSYVRGHFAKYGAQYGRGLLFGKYEGRFWHPARATTPSIKQISYRMEP
jgi:hypothetical protein